MAIKSHVVSMDPSGAVYWRAAPIRGMGGVNVYTGKAASSSGPTRLDTPQTNRPLPGFGIPVRDPTPVSVGPGAFPRVPNVQPVIGIPGVVQRTRRGPSSVSPIKIIGGDFLPKKEVPVAQIPIPAPRVSTGAPVISTGARGPHHQLPTEIPKMGAVTDLLIKSATLLGGQYFQSKVSQPQYVNYPSTGYAAPPQLMPIQATNADFGIPFADVVGTVGREGMVYDPNGNCGNGKWIKRRRRRRKVLVTNSEIAGLAKLKGVVGAGQAMREWIATHS